MLSSFDLVRFPECHDFTLLFVDRVRAEEMVSVTYFSWQKGDIFIWTLQTSIYNSLHKKANKYGNLDAPLLLCVNALEDMAETMDLTDALFGCPAIVARPGFGEEPKQTRLPDGVWQGPNGFQNRGNSAVLAAFRLNPLNLDSVSPELFHHPAAIHPILESQFPLTQHLPNVENTRLEKKVGEYASKYLHLPDSWNQ